MVKTVRRIRLRRWRFGLDCGRPVRQRELVGVAAGRILRYRSRRSDTLLSGFDRPESSLFHRLLVDSIRYCPDARRHSPSISLRSRTAAITFLRRYREVVLKRREIEHRIEAQLLEYERDLRGVGSSSLGNVTTVSQL